jgi:hypothetical protein
VWHICLLLSFPVLLLCKSTGEDGEFDPEQTSIKCFKQDDITLMPRGLLTVALAFSSCKEPGGLLGYIILVIIICVSSFMAWEL